MRVTCLVKRWEHHTASGGYDRLASAVEATIIKRHAIDGLGARIARKIWQRGNATDAYLMDYQFGDWLAELRALGAAALKPPDVLHVLYGDEQLNQLIRLRSLLRCPLVVSFHLPSYRVARRFEIFQQEIGTKIDAAIVLATNQVRSFEEWIDPRKVVYIPHGIDVSRFCPAERRPDTGRLRLLIVGSHMRDWNVVHRVIDRSNQIGLPIDFHVVTGEQYYPYFTCCENTFMYSNVPESELITLYRQSDALLVPVIDCTANNSVLEGLSCGAPVISTLVGGMPDYVSESCGWLFEKGQVEPILELLQRMSDCRDIAESRRNEARVQALRFDWKQIAKRMLVVYQAVSAGRAPCEALLEFERATPGSSSSNVHSALGAPG
jgi:glycosyltransferase involved in cell wall biosynthesis